MENPHQFKTPSKITPRPMASVNAAMGWLDRSHDQIGWLVDEGKLVAFNIATPGARAKCLRILQASVENYRDNGTAFEKPWPEITRLIFPHDRLFVRSTEMDRAFNCDPQQISALVKAGCFSVAKPGRIGHGNAAIVTRASVEKFLWDRLEGGEI